MRKALRGLRARLVDDWRALWRWWSARMMVLAALIQVIPAENFLTVYAMVPADLQMLLPSRTVLVVICTVLALVGRIWKQGPTEAANW